MARVIRFTLALILFFLAACAKNTLQPTATNTPTPFRPETLAPPATAVPPTPTSLTRMDGFHRGGQTFLTWPEREDLTGEVYRVYRSNQPINEKNLAQAQFLIQVGKDSARVWANYFVHGGKWDPRLADRMIIQNNAAQLAEGLGALVWTLAPTDFGGAASGAGYYAVTVIPRGGKETFSAEDTVGPIREAVGNPEPVEITHSPGILAGPGGHFYLQYMDLHNWNATFHAPNATNEYYGFDPKTNDFSNALAYTYDYSIFEPTPDLCGGSVPDPLPVMIFLHGARNNRYATPQDYIYPYCAYGVYPIDESETWYFGFARSHDYRKNTAIQPGDVIENYTEQRILRLISDLMRKPPGPAVDPQRVYLFGHSMGGTGSLAFAERYPNLFAAIYSGQPVTYFRVTPGYDEPWPADLATKWGAQALNLPIAISAPNGWADRLQKYNGVGVYDWENLRAAFDPRARPNRSGDEMVPFGIDHGTADEAVLFGPQAVPLYPQLAASPRAWAGAITETNHEWSVFGWPLPDFATVDKVPFWGLRVIRDETVPGMSHLSVNIPSAPTGPTAYNQTVLWSASWNPWDGAPVDGPGEWRMSFCAVSAGSQKCGSGPAQTVDITPRRMQHFTVTPGKTYAWENRRVSDGGLIARGTVSASADGLLTVPGMQVLPGGNRLSIKPQK